MDLKTVPYTRFLKLEVTAFAEDVIFIIKKHNPELLKIDKVYNMLVDQEPNLDLLTKEYGSHPITQLIIPVRRKFIRYVRSIVYRMNLVVFDDGDNLSDDVVAAQSVTHDYLHRLDRCRSEREKIGRVTGFLQLIDRDEEVKAAFTKFELMGDIELLRRTHSKLQKLLKRRLKSVSERSNKKMRELTAPVITALKNMFKQVEVAMLVNDDLDYLPLFNELNQTMVIYRNMVNRRLLFNKRKNEATKDIEEEREVEKEEMREVKTDKIDKTDKTDKEVEPVSEATGELLTPDLEVLMDNSFDDIEKKELNQEKATAGLTSNFKLPILTSNFKLPIKNDKGGKLIE